MLNCRKCGEAFETHKELYDHRIAKHSTVAAPVQDGPLIIPFNMVEEFAYVGQGSYVRVTCEGLLSDVGLTVDKVKYLRG